MRRSNRSLAHIPESKQYAFIGAMITGTYISILSLLGTSEGFLKMISFPYFLFATGINYFFPIGSCATLLCERIWFFFAGTSFVFIVGLFFYIVGREKEKHKLF